MTKAILVRRLGVRGAPRVGGTGRALDAEEEGAPQEGRACLHARRVLGLAITAAGRRVARAGPDDTGHLRLAIGSRAARSLLIRAHLRHARGVAVLPVRVGRLRRVEGSIDPPNRPCASPQRRRATEAERASRLCPAQRRSCRPRRRCREPSIRRPRQTRRSGLRFPRHTRTRSRRPRRRHPDARRSSTGPSLPTHATLCRRRGHAHVRLPERCRVQ
jgi:hypothetical protein